MRSESPSKIRRIWLSNGPLARQGRNESPQMLPRQMLGHLIRHRKQLSLQRSTGTRILSPQNRPSVELAPITRCRALNMWMAATSRQVTAILMLTVSRESLPVPLSYQVQPAMSCYRLLQHGLRMLLGATLPGTISIWIMSGRIKRVVRRCSLVQSIMGERYRAFPTLPEIRTTR